MTNEEALEILTKERVKRRNASDGLSACNGLVEDDIDLAPTIIEADIN